MHKIGPCGRVSADSPKRAEGQTLEADVGAIAGQDGPNAAMDTETRAAEKRCFPAKKVTFSPQRNASKWV